MTRALNLLIGQGTRPPCRLCGEPANIVIEGNGEPYAYCTQCTDAALERAEVNAAQKERTNEPR